MKICMALSHHTQYIQAIVMHTFIREYVADLESTLAKEAALLDKQTNLLQHIQEMSESLAAMAQEMTSLYNLVFSLEIFIFLTFS